MPRQSRGPAPAPRRPTAAAPPRPAAPTQTRQASTAAHPSQGRAPTAQQAPAQQQSSGGSGLFGQMASTAAGVAVGSSIGHAIGGFFGGGGSQPAQAEAAPLAQQQDSYAAMNANAAPRVCENQVATFRQCMDDNQGNLTVCGWYLDQLKACQQAASQY